MSRRIGRGAAGWARRWGVWRCAGWLGAMAGIVLSGSTGCGPPAPQVPVSLANTVATSVANIAEACGQAYQASAPGGVRGDLAPLQRRAADNGRTLVSVERRNPAWIFQGDTLQQVVALSVRRLFDCHLGSAAQQTEVQTH